MSCNSTGGGRSRANGGGGTPAANEQAQTQSYMPTGLQPYQAQYYDNFLNFVAEAEGLQAGSTSVQQRGAEIINSISSYAAANSAATAMLNTLNNTPYEQVGTPEWNKAVAQFRMMQAAANYLWAIGQTGQ